MFSTSQFIKYMCCAFYAGALMLCATPVYAAKMVTGADISYETPMRNEGKNKWRDSNGTKKDLRKILKDDFKMSAVRLRVWVKPDKGFYGINNVADQARAAKKRGMDVMLTLHYSDTWADPSQQTTPASWNGLNINALQMKVLEHTESVLKALKDEGVEPKWVQIGNETKNGMLWPLGNIGKFGKNPWSSSWMNYRIFITSGLYLVKAVYPNIKTIIHLPDAWDYGAIDYNLNGLIENGITPCDLENASKFGIFCWINNWDIIGLSHYPDLELDWGRMDGNAIVNTINARNTAAMESAVYLQKKYGKDVMFVEFGMGAEPEDVAFDALSYTLSEGAKNCVSGVFYWEPQAFDDYNGYKMHAWYGEYESNSKQYRPRSTLYAFKTYKNQTVKCNKNPSSPPKYCKACEKPAKTCNNYDTNPNNDCAAATIDLFTKG